ncbi:MAG: hypothetical protein H0T89_26410 [Deltaproteobacteria bacterium]|nr:hypothetical protein [Deltaproteobacteria bacterium]MDQ3299836.1 hypothetical protein [Myxococcota bacterium]
MQLELERIYDTAFPLDKLEALVGVIRSVTGDRGATELLRSSLTWTATAHARRFGPTTMVVVTVKDGTTHLVVSDRLDVVARGYFGGLIGGSTGLPTLAVVLGALWGAPIVAVAAPILWLGGTFTGARALFQRAARKRAESLRRVFDAVAAEIAVTLDAKASSDR